MRDHAPAPLAIDTPDEPPPPTIWSPGPGRMVLAFLSSAGVSILALVIGALAGWGYGAVFLMTALLVILIGLVAWISLSTVDGRLARILRWWL